MQIESLTVNFGRFVALDRISISMRAGEVFGFLGPNGAGKSTTIRVLTGQIHPSGGRVRVDGRDLSEAFSELRAIFGYVPDFDNHFEELSAADNLKFFARLYRVPLRRIPEVLERVGLDDAADIAVRNFSKGMRKKLSIAREILHRPRILYLDEPTANLDPHAKVRIRRLLVELAREGCAVFTTTHDMEEAEEICDRIAILDRGRIVDIDTPTRFKTRFATTRVDAVLRSEAGETHETFDLSQPDDRARLARKIEAGEVLTLHTRETNLREVFLRLTGHPFERSAKEAAE